MSILVQRPSILVSLLFLNSHLLLYMFYVLRRLRLTSHTLNECDGLLTFLGHTVDCLGVVSFRRNFRVFGDHKRCQRHVIYNSRETVYRLDKLFLHQVQNNHVNICNCSKIIAV